MRKILVAVLGSLLAVTMLAQPAAAKQNSVEKASVKTVNTERKAAGLGKVKSQKCLQRYAERHARTMAKKNRMYHQSSKQLGKIMRKCKLSAVGENIARGTSMSSGAVVAAWMGSPRHRANILNGSFNRAGAAYRTGSGKQRFWVHVYGRR